MPKVEDRSVSFAVVDNSIYIFPPGAHSVEAHVQLRKVQWNEDGSIYLHPSQWASGPTPTPAPTRPPTGDFDFIPWPGIGPHPRIELAPGQTKCLRVPYSSARMGVATAGTQDETLTNLEQTASPTPGDRGWWDTPEAIVWTEGRGGGAKVPNKPAKSQGDPAGGGTVLYWSPAGAVDAFARPNDGKDWCINFHNPTNEKGYFEFYATGELAR